MKLSRNEFKAIVKECLIEILGEGLVTTNQTNRKLSESTLNRIEQKKPIASNKAVQHRPIHHDVIRHVSGGDRVLSEILSDTAKTTLPNMLENENRKQPAPVGAVERIVEASTPEELFGTEMTQNWAALAFSEPASRKKNS